jgi:hypothetical protein
MSLADLPVGYFDLKSLARYSSCSVRWLRDRLVDPVHPLPHHRVEGKILIKREDFDQWIGIRRIVFSAENLGELVDCVVTQLQTGPRRP